MVKRRVPDWEKRQLAEVPRSGNLGLGCGSWHWILGQCGEMGRDWQKKAAKMLWNQTKDMTVLFKLIFGFK